MQDAGQALKQQIEYAVDELATALAAGRSDAMEQYLAVLARFHRYSLGNQLLIALQKPEARRVAGFRAWQRLGRQVKPGEHAIRILAPIMRTKRSNKDADNDRATNTDADEQEYQQVVGFRQVCVFDISQTQGKPLPEPPRVHGDPGVKLWQLEAVIKRHGIRIETTAELRGADGAATGGRIMLREGLSPAERFSVMVHEYAHLQLHQSSDRHETPHRVRETEAEAVAFVVCTAAGLEPGTACADYIHLHRGDRQTLLASLLRIRNTAATILDGLGDTPAHKRRRGGIHAA